MSFPRTRRVLACALLFAVTAPVHTAAPAVAGAAAPQITGIDVTAGNLMGVTEVTLDVSNVFSVDDVLVSVGGQDAFVMEVVPGQSVKILTPAVAEPTGTAVDITVRTSGGIDTLPAAYLYTPTLSASVIGSTTAGGGVLVDWITSPAKADELVIVWVGDPTQPYLNHTLPAYAGLIHEEPGHEFVSVTEDNHPFALHFGPLPPGFAGFPFNLQGLVKGEGAHKGSFTNVVTIAVP